MKNFFKKLIGYTEPLFRAFRSRSISTQLILTIVLIFSSFFVLQAILNSQFFKNYFTAREFEDIRVELRDYVDNMNADDVDYYDEMYSFTKDQYASSVIVDINYRVLESSFTNYTIEVEEIGTEDIYKILVPNNDHIFETGELMDVVLVEYNATHYRPLRINSHNELIIYSTISCDELDCISLSGETISVNKPNNMNYQFADDAIMEVEISKLSEGLVTFTQYDDGLWYESNDGPNDTLVFVNPLGDWQNIVTVVPIADTDSISRSVTSYTYYVYLTAIVIIVLWSFRLSGIISKPIQNIELVAKEIASLNFNVEADERNNRETTSLSNSINLIARNLRNTLDTLNTKNSELMQLYSDQTKQVSLKKQLVSSISHELKTPLMIMQVTIQGILDGIIDQEDHEAELMNVLEEINKSSFMIQDMLQIYRLDDANSQLDITEFNLSSTIDFFIKDFEKVFESNNLNLELNVPDYVMVEADRKLIKRVISNFITNAIKYTPENEKIKISLVDEIDTVYFELINHGSKIAEKELENIWMPFFRIEQTQSRRLDSKGSGIGLYLVSEILKAHQAEFGIENCNNGVKAFFRINKKVD